MSDVFGCSISQCLFSMDPIPLWDVICQVSIEAQAILLEGACWKSSSTCGFGMLPQTPECFDGARF